MQKTLYNNAHTYDEELGVCPFSLSFPQKDIQSWVFDLPFELVWYITEASQSPINASTDLIWIYAITLEITFIHLVIYSFQVLCRKPLHSKKHDTKKINLLSLLKSWFPFPRDKQRIAVKDKSLNNQSLISYHTMILSLILIIQNTEERYHIHRDAGTAGKCYIFKWCMHISYCKYSIQMWKSIERCLNT